MPVTSATEVISAIVTPAILILASSSLITATANRQSKLLERVRGLTNDVENLRDDRAGKKEFLGSQLHRATDRTRLVQRALVFQYLSLGGLILTSVAVGVSRVAGLYTDKFTLGAIFVSLSCLFYASVLLIRESRLAMRAINAEMDYVRKLTAV